MILLCKLTLTLSVASDFKVSKHIVILPQGKLDSTGEDLIINGLQPVSRGAAPAVALGVSAAGC